MTSASHRYSRDIDILCRLQSVALFISYYGIACIYASFDYILYFWTTEDVSLLLCVSGITGLYMP